MRKGNPQPDYREVMEPQQRSTLWGANQRRKILSSVFNPKVRLHRLDIHQIVLNKKGASEDRRPDVDQQDPELLKIKEDEKNLWTSLEGEQLSGNEETDEEQPLFSQLHQHQMEDRGFIVGSSANQIEDEDDFSSSETGDSEDGEEDHHDGYYKLRFLSDSEPKAKNSEESRAPESDVNSANKCFSSSECDKKQLHNCSLQTHMTNHSNVKSCKEVQGELRPFSCDNCGKSFMKKRTLNEHNKTHTEQKQFGCDQCGTRFRCKSILKSHMLIHTGQKPFSCNVCGTRFRCKSILNIHMLIHTGQKPFSCDLCGTRFRQKTNLNNHMLIHTGLKPFKCDLCGTRFTRKSTLVAHMLIHTGQKPFCCAVCGRRFRERKMVTTHMRVHTGEKTV